MVGIRSRSVPIRILILILICVLALIQVYQMEPIYGDPSSVQKSPSAYENAEWRYPEKAYISDDTRTYEEADGETVTYLNYSFTGSIPGGSTIDSVIVGCEGSVTTTDTQRISACVSWDGGSSWGAYRDFGFTTSESNKSVDVTSDTTWNLDKLSNANFRVKLKYEAQGVEGCFTPGTYFISWNETATAYKKQPWILKEIQKAQEGDLILVSNHWEGIHWEEISTLSIHNGTWEVYDIWCGTVPIEYKYRGEDKVFYWNHHGQVTGEHPCLIYRDERWMIIPASEIKLGDGQRHITHERRELKPGEYIVMEDHWLETDMIWKIDVSKFTGLVYDLKTDDPRDHFFMTYITDGEMEILKTLAEDFGVNLEMYVDPERAGKWTGYVDWAPVTVHYTEEGEEEWIDCQYIGVNNTLAGEPTLFSSEWSDIYEAEGLSHFMFSTNNTGAWANDTWSSSWRATYWADAEKTLNSTEDLTMAFRFYINNTAGDEYAGTICFLTTPVTRIWEGPFFGVTHRVDYGLTLLMVSPPERSPNFGEFLYDRVDIPVELIILNREDRARYFSLSYAVFSESGELVKEGDLSQEIEAEAQAPMGFSFQVPYGKRDPPKNFSVALQVNGGKDQIDLELTLSHSWLSFWYPLISLGIIGLIVGVAYYFVRRRKRGPEVK